MVFDKIIIGAGLYGLYSAVFCGKRKENVLVLECEDAPFKRATWINQARVHMGYHYPRSYSTAIKSAGYFKRFVDDFRFCIHSAFDQVYATSANFSWTSAVDFERFCNYSGIRCEAVNPLKYFNEGLCDGAFLTEEYAFDALVLRDFFLSELSHLPNVEVRFNTHIQSIDREDSYFSVRASSGETYQSDFVLNATYASSNQISQMAGFDPFKIKYEICEIILCDVGEALKDIGITVMDGPFFSIMPFGKTNHHSLTSVTFTPHVTSYEPLPSFECQAKSGDSCTQSFLANCNDCSMKPESAWHYMATMARKYLRKDFSFEYAKSLYSMKPILKASEIDDSRPTVIRVASENPTFVSVLSGKINTVYDLEEVLEQ